MLNDDATLTGRHEVPERAIVLCEPGPVDNLELTQLPVPTPPPAGSALW